MHFSQSGVKLHQPQNQIGILNYQGIKRGLYPDAIKLHMKV